MDALIRDTPAPGILRFAMNQPGKKNAMNFAMREALKDALLAAAPDPAVKALVLTGADGNFSAGGDIQALMTLEKADFRRYLQGGHAVVKSFWDFEKPVVAAIEGVGVGGGLALAMCCDHIVMGHRARVGFTFVKIGFVPDWGTPFTVSRRIGPAAATRLFQDGELLGAAEALALGLVDELVDDDQVQSAAIATATRLGDKPPRAFALTKRLMRQLPGSLDAALEMEALAQDSCFKSAEFLNGTARFIK